MKTKRRKSDLILKSIWDEDSVEMILPNRRHRSKMWNYIIKNPDKSIAELPLHEWNCPKDAFKAIPQHFVKFTSKVIEKQESIRGNTTKLLIKLQDGHEVHPFVYIDEYSVSNNSVFCTD